MTTRQHSYFTILALALFALLSFSSEARARTAVWDSVTVCEYNWFEEASGWRNHDWSDEDCSNGTPGPTFKAIGQATNLKGVASMADCYASSAGHYNHPTYNGTDTGRIRCLYFDPALVSTSTAELTLCSYFWPANTTGWRWRTWTSGDCSNGVPHSQAVAVGSGINGAGTSGQVDCYPTEGGHYNYSGWPGATNGRVTCLYLNPAAVPNSTKPEMTFCTVKWTGFASGERDHVWESSDCSNGVPLAGHVAIGQSINGNGTVGQSQCTTKGVTHFNDPLQVGATNGEAKCLFSMPSKYYDAVPASTVEFNYDLDDDGSNDTNLSLDLCSNNSPDVCLTISSKLMNFGTSRQVELYSGALQQSTNSMTTNYNLKDRFRLIGDHTGDGIQEIFVHYARENVAKPSHPLAVISIISSLGDARFVDQPSPDGLTENTVYPKSTGYSYAGQPKGADGKRYPYLAASFEEYGEWRHVCLFRPTLPGKKGLCKPGFAEISFSIDNLHYLPVSTPGLRDLGAIHNDLNNDGWEDISLIFRYGYASLSTKDAEPLVSTIANVFPGTVDVSAKQASTTYLTFHGGRTYGMHKAFTDPNTGAKRSLVVAGKPVHFGAFLSDRYCSVSRYIAMYEAPANQPTGQPFQQDLLWSNYRGFYTTTEYENSSAIAWQGDLLDECVHYPADSLSNVEGTDVVVFNYFNAQPDPNDAIPDSCDAELANYDNDPQAWTDCADEQFAQPGEWGFQALNLDTGISVTGGTGIYIWGMSDQLLPSNEMAYIVEHVPAGSPFNFLVDTSNPIHVYTHENGGFVSQGTIPNNWRPLLKDQKHTDTLSSGNQSVTYDLILEDRNNDGNMDIQMYTATETWVGFVNGQLQVVQ